MSYTANFPVAQSTAKPRATHTFARDTLGHYVEPFWCSARLFAVESFGQPGARVLDPAAGWGRILRAVAAAGYTPVAADVVDRLDRRGLERVPFELRDFVANPPPARSVWSITCNPPFDHIQKFCEIAIEVVHYKVAMLTPLRRLPAARWLQKLPLETVWLLTPRPSMPPGSWIEAGNVPGGGSQDFCWLAFNKQHSGSPRLRWLHRDGARS
jgi:hypothetical protein